MDYIQTPIQPYRVGRTYLKMSQAKATKPEATAEYSKSQGEHRKDIVIAILVAGIIAFIGGVTFQAKQQDAINTAVKGAQTTAPADAPVKK